MTKQRTIGAEFWYPGRCFYSGCNVRADFEPAPPDTGIVFITKQGRVKASLENALASRCSVLLKDGDAQVYNVEHVLATLWAYGVDNAYIAVRRVEPCMDDPLRHWVAYYTNAFSKMLGLTKAEVFPNCLNEEQTLCKILDTIARPVEQNAKRRELRMIPTTYSTDHLHFEKIPKGLVVRSTTNYNPVGEEIVEFEITQENYAQELAITRRCAKHLQHIERVLPKSLAEPLWSAFVMLMYPDLGVGHSFNSSNVFLPVPTVEEWRAQELKNAELARHTIVDRLGAIALLPGRLEGVKVDAKFSGHANDIKVMRELVKYLKVD